MKEIKEIITKYAEILPLNKSISTSEAEKRAGDFLTVMASITDWRHILSGDKIRLQSAHNAVYAEELSKATGKTVTENKVTVEASEAYQFAREELEKIENDLSYLKAYYDIFNNAHVFYRQMSRGEAF